MKVTRNGVGKSKHDVGKPLSDSEWEQLAALERVPNTLATLGRRRTFVTGGVGSADISFVDLDGKKQHFRIHPLEKKMQLWWIKNHGWKSYGQFDRELTGIERGAREMRAILDANPHLIERSP